MMFLRGMRTMSASSASTIRRSSTASCGWTISSASTLMIQSPVAASTPVWRAASTKPVCGTEMTRAPSDAAIAPVPSGLNWSTTMTSSHQASPARTVWMLSASW